MASISSPGLGSGLDVSALVQGLIQAERQPAQLRFDQREAGLQTRLSAFGALKGALVALRDSLGALRGPDLFGRITATISQPSLFTASTTTGVRAGNHRVEVVQLASAQKLLSAGFSANAALGTGTLALTLGETSFEVAIDSGSQTLAGIRDRINAAGDNPGIIASIIAGDDGEHLVLTATQTGSNKAITVLASGGDGGLARLDHDPLNAIAGNFTEELPAADAQIRIDGVLRSSSTNRIESAVDGVSLDLLSASPGNFADLQLAPDSTGARSTIKKFIETYNALAGTLANLSRYDPDSGSAGPLLGDSAVRALSAQLRREFGAPLRVADGDMKLLSAVGVSTDKTGLLTLNESRLTEQLKLNPAGVTALFTGAGGLVERMDRVLSGYGDANGVVDARTRSLQNAIRSLDKDRERLDQRMENLQKRYLAQFTALDGLVGQLQSTSTFLTQQIANMNAINRSG
jgi:flagellar hook-associated protein 2